MKKENLTFPFRTFCISQKLKSKGLLDQMTFFHVATAIWLTSLYTFTTIFISIFPWLGDDTIGAAV